MILGQAHYTLAYLYQYKANKLKPAKVFLLLLTGLALFLSYSLFSYTKTLVFLTAYYFVLHFVLHSTIYLYF